MAQRRFIQVLMPLHLEWDPYYSLPEGMEVQPGMQVKVRLAGRSYYAVVSAVDVTPPEDIRAKVLQIDEVPEHLPAITPQELRFWQALADYYLCSVGEVFKAAYPALRNKAVKRPKPLAPIAAEAQPVPELSAAQKTALEGIRKGFRQGKTVLLHGVAGAGKTELYLRLIQDTLDAGKSVLYLVPEIALSQQLVQRIAGRFPEVLLYHSGETEARRRKVAQALQERESYLVMGTRSALLLPHQDLGLIVVDEEQDNSYKQDAPAPRYHARESSILLAGIHGARVLLGSETPSLESIYNTEIGLFSKVDLKESFNEAGSIRIALIDTTAEQKKQGMLGSLSKKLIALMHEALEAGEQVLMLVPRSWESSLQEELQTLFPEQRSSIQLASAFSGCLRGPQPGLVALLGADSLLSRQDFRADERAFQLLEQFRGRCRSTDRPGVFAIQTREAGHPVFQRLLSGEDHTPALLQERKAFGYPPFTRLIHVQVKDINPKRCQYHANELARMLQNVPELRGTVMGPFAPALELVNERHIRQIRITLTKDKLLKTRKKLLVQCISQYEKKTRYEGRITIDVDPL